MDYSLWVGHCYAGGRPLNFSGKKPSLHLFSAYPWTKMLFSY